MGIPQLPGRILRSTAKKFTKKDIKWAAKKKSEFLKEKEEVVEREETVELENAGSDEDEVLSKHMTKKQLRLASKKAKVSRIVFLMKSHEFT